MTPYRIVYEDGQDHEVIEYELPDTTVVRHAINYGLATLFLRSWCYNPPSTKIHVEWQNKDGTWAVIWMPTE